MNKLVCIAVAGFLTAGYSSVADADEPAASPVRIGTFDSRLVAIAYVRSDDFENHLRPLQPKLKKAKADGNEKLVKELGDQGKAMQDLIHKQGFSTWPIDDILKTMEDEIPGIAKKAKVDLIVSKWDIVYERKGIEYVDVTDRMVKRFDPSEETKKVLEEIKKKKPVPLKDLKSHH